MRSAVCVLLPLGSSGLYLSVSRRNNPKSIGTPGGKVDPGETNLDGIMRETFEEVGILLDKVNLEPIYSAACSGQETFWVTTYLAKWPEGVPLEFSAEEGLSVRWASERELTDPEICPFARYNAGAFAAMKSYLKD